MAIPKTSQAVKKTAHFNPIHPEEKEVLAIIEGLEARGYNFKQVVVDAILRADGKEPAVYQHEHGAILPQLEQMFANFAQEIVNQVKTGRIQADDTEEDGEGRPSPFAQKFAKSFAQRQQRAMGDEE